MSQQPSPLMMPPLEARYQIYQHLDGKSLHRLGKVSVLLNLESSKVVDDVKSMPDSLEKVRRLTPLLSYYKNTKNAPQIITSSGRVFPSKILYGTNRWKAIEMEEMLDDILENEHKKLTHLPCSIHKAESLEALAQLAYEEHGRTGGSALRSEASIVRSRLQIILN